MDAAVSLLIRPPRFEYLASQLGPTRFTAGTIRCKRRDFELTNSRGLRLQCSHWEPMDKERPSKRMGCVIYLHGNSGSRMDAAENAIFILHAFRLTFFAFDFAGAGHSEGKYISLGYHEQDDVEVVLNYLKSTDSVSHVCLWGRSMGAVTAMMYSAKAQERQEKGDQEVVVPSALILDSPFSSLMKLIPEVVDSVEIKGQYIKQLPKKVVGGLLGIGIPILRKAIKSRADFDIAELEPIACAPKCTIPAFFIQGRSDTLVQPHHTELLYNAYGSAVKRRIVVDGGHNTGRGSLCLEEISSFLFTHFLNDGERQLVGGADGDFPRLRLNVECPDVPHFLCRRLPYPLIKEEIKTFDSMVALVITHKSVQLHQPFTGYVAGEYRFGGSDEEYSIRGYGTENIGSDNDQKLFYIRATEPFCESDVVLLFLTNRAEEISELMKMRIDSLLREKLSNVNMASRIEQIVRKLVARRIQEQVTEQRRKRRAQKEEKIRGRTRTSTSKEEHHFAVRLRRNTARIFSMIGGGSRDSDKAAKETTSGKIEKEKEKEPEHHEHENEKEKDGACDDAATAAAAAALFVGSPSFAISETAATTTDDGLRAVPADQEDLEETEKDNGPSTVSQQEEKTVPRRETTNKINGEQKEATDDSLVDEEEFEIHVDENEVIGTIEEVLCEIGMVTEKDRPHLHAVIHDTVQEVIKRELDNYRRSRQTVERPDAAPTAGALEDRAPEPDDKRKRKEKRHLFKPRVLRSSADKAKADDAPSTEPTREPATAVGDVEPEPAPGKDVSAIEGEATDVEVSLAPTSSTAASAMLVNESAIPNH